MSTQICAGNKISLERGPQGEWGPGRAACAVRPGPLSPPRTPFKGNCVWETGGRHGENPGIPYEFLTMSKIQTRKLAASTEADRLIGSTGRRNVGRRFFCSNWPCQVLIIVRPAVQVNLLPRGLLITGHGHNHW